MYSSWRLPSRSSTSNYRQRSRLFRKCNISADGWIFRIQNHKGHHLNVIQVLMLLFIAVYDDFASFFLQLSLVAPNPIRYSSWVRDSGVTIAQRRFKLNQTDIEPSLELECEIQTDRERDKRINEQWAMRGEWKIKTRNWLEKGIWFIIIVLDLLSVTVIIHTHTHFKHSMFLSNVAYISAYFWEFNYIQPIRQESWFFDLTTRNFGRGATGGTVLFLCYKCIITTYWLTLWTWRLVDFHVGNGPRISVNADVRLLFRGCVIVHSSQITRRSPLLQYSRDKNGRTMPIIRAFECFPIRWRIGLIR